MTNWDAYRTETGAINLRAFARETISNWEQLPQEDRDYIEEILGEVESLQPIVSRQVAAVALTMARQMLLMGQVMGSFMQQLSVPVTPDQKIILPGGRK